MTTFNGTPEIQEVISRLKALNAQVTVNGDQLDISLGKGLLDNELKTLIRNNKQGLIAYVNKQRNMVYSRIDKAVEADGYVLSSSQRRLWVLNQLSPGNVAYNMPDALFFEGELNELVLEQSFAALISRHEILRTTFREDASGEVRQYIHPASESKFVLERKDLWEEPDQVHDQVHATLQSPFDLAEGPLLRASLYRLEENRWLFSYAMHHIISDGWSMGVLITELLAFYNAFLHGMENPYQPLAIQYKDYACWQQSELQNGSLVLHKNYWLEQFSGELPVLELPADRIRPAIKTYNGAFLASHVSAERTKEINKLCRDQGCTLFMGLLAIVNTLLYRYSGQQDIVIGSPVAGREHTDLEGQIGFYLNTLALRSRFSGSDRFTELLTKVRELTLAAYEHQAYPFDELVDELNLQRDLSRSPLFDVMLVLQNAPDGGAAGNSLEGMLISPYQEAKRQNSKFDLSFICFESVEGLSIALEYNNDIYSADWISRFEAHFQQLISAIIASPGDALDQLNLLSAAERLQLLETFNDTNAVYPVAGTAISLFEKQVLLNPARPAVFSGGLELSYEELNRQSNRLTAYLTDVHGIGPGDLAGVCLERSEQLVISILAVLKTGAAYVPVDPAYPVERINYMQQDSGCKVMIDPAFLVEYTDSSANYSDENPGIHARADDLAYVIYTSGSTGQPKGVMIEHSSLVNLCYWHQQMFSVTSADRGSLYAGVAFDASAWELFPYLLFGAAVVVVPDEIRLDTGLLNDYYHQQKITISFLPSQIGEAFYEEDNHSLRYLLLGGDRVNSYQPKAYRVVNNYGPTENSVVSTSYFIDEASPLIPIGKPVSNTRIYILGDGDGLVPVGVSGELCISGAGLARGYLNKEALTREKFVPNPYLEGELMYRSGDLARWRADGNIEFIGRKDDQVKVRGYRIELGEVEHVLGGHPAVSSVVVLAPLNDSGERFLVAYLVGSAALDIPALKAYLSGLLPGYMVPAYFMQLDSLPLTLNGKIDRKALPAVDHDGAERASVYQAPENELQEQLALIWSEVLGISQIGINDHFFELGGNSLKIIKLSKLVSSATRLNITVSELFQYTNISSLAAYILQKTNSAQQTIAEENEPDNEALQDIFSKFDID
ncbi:amino acid adenylation domain-containing protein [Pedobacter sp. AW31-3R]|uniref:non-ribosomal peptide synthetase n=1 Tax=Pedobacter sp. AW31-3R TaxID=3445781 RepID=UPI003F9F6F1A